MTVKARRRPGRPSGGVRVVNREVVLDNAERVIRRDGASASLEAIARESGVTKPMIYARVGGRTDLANALAERLTNRMLEATRVAVGASQDGRSALAALIRSTLETVEQHRELFLYVTAGNTAEDRLQLASFAAAPVARQLQRWREDDSVDPAVAQAWAYATIGMLNFVSLWWIDEADRSPAELADQLTDLLWSGLAPR